MLKMKSIICTDINGKDYQFVCDPDSPLSDALEANKQVNAFLLGRAQQIKEEQKPPVAVEEEQPKSE